MLERVHGPGQGMATNQNRTDGDEGPLVNVVGAVFQFLKALTPISILRATVLRGRSKAFLDNFTDFWIVLRLGASLAAAIVVALKPDWPTWAPLAVGLFAAYSLFDVIIIQVNVLLFDPYFHRKAFLAGKVPKPYALRGRYRLLLALLANFLEIGFWYTAAYLYLSDAGQLSVEAFDANGLAALPLMFQECMRALITFDVSSFESEQGTLAFNLVIIQSFVGMFMTIVMLARVVSLLPTPKADSDGEP